MSLEVTVAAPFRHLHKGQLQRSEFVYYLAIDRMWMSRDQAGLLLDLAVEQGLVNLRNGVVVPLFEVGEVTVPLGYRPGAEDFQRPDAERTLLARIAAATGRDEREVAAEANRLITERFDGHSGRRPRWSCSRAATRCRSTTCSLRSGTRCSPNKKKGIIPLPRVRARRGSRRASARRTGQPWR